MCEGENFEGDMPPGEHRKIRVGAENRDECKTRGREKMKAHGGSEVENLVISLGVGFHDVINPVKELTHFDVDTRVVRLCTSLTP